MLISVVGLPFINTDMLPENTQALIQFGIFRVSFREGNDSAGSVTKVGLSINKYIVLLGSSYSYFVSLLVYLMNFGGLQHFSYTTFWKEKKKKFKNQKDDFV
jgi:hypothetical protein